MSYNRNKPKPRPRYRFEGKKLSDLPADVDWMALARLEKKVTPEILKRHGYWFQRGTHSALQRSKNIQLEAEARRSHIKATHSET